MTDTQERGTAPAGRRSRLVAIHRDSWTLMFPPYQEGGLNLGQSVVRGHGDSWVDDLHELTDDAVGIDSRTMRDDERRTWEFGGPRCDPFLPDGTVHKPRGVQPFDEAPVPNRDRRFGNADVLDYVSLDVYVRLHRRFGGRVFDPREEALRLQA